MMSTSSVQSTRSGFDHRQAQLWQQLLERRTGVRAASLNLDWLAAGIGELADELGFTDTMDYYRQLACGGDNHPQWTRLLDRILVRDTRFLRHRESMNAVGRIWQDYQNERQQNHQKNNSGSSFTAWSVGCSSGEETYSLALVLADNCLDHQVSYGVIGMDISAQAIATARNGIYSSAQLAALSQRQRDHYFQCRKNGDYQVGEQLRRRTCFIRGNVLQVAADSSQHIPQMQGADLIYCQNLLPYFRRWQRQQLVAGLAANLKPGGHLIVGPGELANWQPPHTERVAEPAVQMYRRNTCISASAGVSHPAPMRIRK
ncbi:CheR family methyltransferase [Porticoccus sp. W117]|uniref:CheR family methyltransferase n=1 Tax=Porticoccus sp. W117 TaxID=3054777 RepID=UPI002597F98D|nr:CheR family methyltransferase [Porticoccus sp. W117]MDM3872057.1 CheR family methyltransferase [Porticoccus sp. W117]